MRIETNKAMLMYKKYKPTIKIKKLDPSAVIPKFMSEGAACADVSSLHNILLPSNIVVVVHTGLAVAVPKGYLLEVRSRSGLAAKGIMVANSPGTIDSDYRGEVIVLLVNIGDKTTTLDAGSRVAQIRLVKLEDTDFEEVSELDDTERGTGGFGSTGI